MITRFLCRYRTMKRRYKATRRHFTVAAPAKKKPETILSPPAEQKFSVSYFMMIAVLRMTGSTAHKLIGAKVMPNLI